MKIFLRRTQFGIAAMLAVLGCSIIAVNAQTRNNSKPALETRVAVLEEFVLALNQRITALETGSPSDSSPTLEKAVTADVIESTIDGEFEGWEGDTIFKLTNGQIWQQTSFSFHYHYAYMPEVTIYKASAGYKMMVDGISETIYVKRIK